jgi:hypothetical protein
MRTLRGQDTRSPYTAPHWRRRDHAETSHAVLTATTFGRRAGGSKELREGRQALTVCHSHILLANPNRLRGTLSLTRSRLVVVVLAAVGLLVFAVLLLGWSDA